MKPYIKADIDGQELDFEDAETLPLALNYQLEDVEDFQKKKGSEAFNIPLPATRRNDKAFNTFHNPSIEDLTSGQIFRGTRPIRIQCMGNELLIGKAFLVSATHKEKPSGYKINCYGGNADWMVDLKETTLYDLLKGISFTLNQATLEASWAFAGTDMTLPYVFAPAKYGAWLDDVLGNDNNFNLSSLKPSVSVYWLLYKGLASAGYRIDSTFFDTEFFRRQVMPWVWGNFLSSEGTKYELHKFRSKSVATYYGDDSLTTPAFVDMKCTNDTTDGMFDNNNTVPNGDYEYFPGSAFEMRWTYKTPYYGPLEVGMSIDVNLNLSATSNSNNDVWLWWYVNGIAARVDHIGHVQAPYVSVFGQQTVQAEVNTQFFSATINPGDTISCRIQVRRFESKTGQSHQEISIGQFQVDYFRIPVGGTISFDSYNALKKVKFLDFFRGIIDAYNLQLATDNVAKAVLIEPTHKNPYSEGFFNNDWIDWNFKQDLTKDSELQLFSDYEREVNFKFKDDSADGLLKLIQDRNTTVLGRGKYVLPNRFKTGQKDVENRFFSPVMHYEADQFKDITGVSPQLPAFVPENISNTSRSEAQNTFAPKLCYYKGITSGVGGWRWLGVNQSTLPFMFAVNYKTNGQFDPVLSYSDERIGNPGEEVIAKGLLKNFFLQRLAIMRNGQYYLTNLKLQNIDVAKPWHREHKVLKGQKWELIQVNDYKPLKDDSTEVFMRKHSPITIDDFNLTFPAAANVLSGNLGTNTFEIKYAQLKCLANDIPTPQ